MVTKKYMSMKKIVSIVMALLPLMFVSSCVAAYYSVETDFAPDGSSVRKVSASDTSVFWNNFVDVAGDAAVSDVSDSVVFPEGIKLMRYSLSASCASPEEYYSGWNESMERKFRWFRTTYHYRAEFPMPSGMLLKISDFMSDAELEMWLRGDSSASPFNGCETFGILSDLSDKFDRWANWCCMEASRIIFSDYLTASENEDILSHKDEIYSSADSASDFLEWGDPEDFAALLDKYYGTSRYSEVYRADKAAIDRRNSEMSDTFFRQFDEMFRHSVTMPGKLVSTNSRAVEGNTVMWYVDSVRSLDRPYVMEAESVRTNVWAWVVTVLAVMLLLLVLKPVRRY